jgi:acetyl esterase/lipase
LFTPPPVTHPVNAKVLALHGWEDPMAKPESVLAFADEMTRAGADWQVHAYGGTVHAFTNPEANNYAAGMAYNAAADRRAFESIVAPGPRLKAVSVVLARSAPAIKTASEVDASFGHVSVFVSSESTNLMREAIRMHSGKAIRMR